MALENYHGWESCWRGRKQWGKQWSLLLSQHLGIKEWYWQIPGWTSEISDQKRAVQGMAKILRRTLQASGRGSRLPREGEREIYCFSKLMDANLTLHIKTELILKKGPQGSQIKHEVTYQPRSPTLIVLVTLRGEGYPPIEAVIGIHFQFALGTGYDGKDITRMAFSENITFTIITVVVAAAADGAMTKERKRRKERLSMLSTFHSLVTARIEQLSSYWHLMFLP